MAKALKILSCGDVCGHFSVFMKKLETVHKKAGPFEMVLCVGSFFAQDMSEEDEKVWNDIKAGKRTPPMPIYILGPNKEPERQFYSDLNGYEICENVVYLGLQGCLTTKEGLKIAYASGGAEAMGLGFKYDQYKIMEAQLRWTDYNFQGVDVLITSEWPFGVASGSAVKPESITEDEIVIGSKLISKLAKQVKPRYHFAGLRRCHFERQPYRNHQVLKESAKHVTRFIGLAEVGNKAKMKWIYAFNIVPIKLIDRSELVTQPTDVTDSPFNDAELESVGTEKRSQFFYDMNAPMEQRNNRKRQGGPNQRGDFQKRRAEAAGPCWFCLSGTEVEKHLIVSIGDHTYLALPKGGLTPHHVLILPIAHYPSLLDCPKEVLEEINRFKSALRKCFKQMNQVVVFFERNYKSFHLQLQVVPLPSECKPGIKSAFQDIGDSQNIELNEIPEHSELSQMAQTGTPYFYAELPSKTKLFHRVKSGFPIHFGREVLASPALLNKEEAIDWRDCKVDTEDETRMTAEFRELFKPFDFTLEEDDD